MASLAPADIVSDASSRTVPPAWEARPFCAVQRVPVRLCRSGHLWCPAVLGSGGPEETTPSSSDSRRARREAETGHRGRRRTEIPSHQRWAPRMAVLGTLAVATIAMPLSAGAQDGPAAPYGPDGRPIGPSALDLVNNPTASEPTSEYVASAPKIDGRVQAASRSVERAPLPNCDPSVVTTIRSRLAAV